MKKIALILFITLFSKISWSQSCYQEMIKSPSPFLGNYGELIEMLDGTYWKVIDFQYLYLYEYYPTVTVCPFNGVIQIGNHEIAVQRIGSSPPTPVVYYSFEACNKSDVTLSIAYGRFDSADANATFSSHGWYNIEPNSCSTISTSTTRFRYFYIYATGSGYLVSDQQRKVKMCVNSTPFDVTGTENCESRGYTSVSPRQVDTGTDTYKYTLNLTGLSSTDPSVECVFNWAANSFANLFWPSNETTILDTNFYVRNYSATGAKLFVQKTNSRLYYTGPVTNNSIVDLGDFLYWAVQAGCI